MKIYVNTTSELHKIFKSLLEHKWVGYYNGWEYQSVDILSDAIEGGGGYSPKKIGELLPPREKKVVLLDGNLDNLARFGRSDDNSLFILSIKGYRANFDLLKMAVKAVEIFALDSVSCKNSDCMFFSSFLSKSDRICEECQLELVKQKRIESIIRLSAIGGLERQRIPFINFCDYHIGNAIKQLGISFSIPEVQFGATNLIIDSIALPGSSVRDWLRKASTIISTEKANIKNRYQSTGPTRGGAPPFLIASRRWNSWTPNQPLKEESRVLHYKTGGGYFFSDGKTNIAIDPGYGYLDMLFQHGLTVMDIDCIIITHDHPDHLAELQNILGLRYNYSDKCEPLKIYCNPSSYFIMSGFNLYYCKLLKDGRANVLFPDAVFPVGDIDVETTAMFHKEIYDHLGHKKSIVNRYVKGTSKALGLKFTFKDSTQNKMTFVIPGDTSFPKRSKDIERLIKFYGEPDVAAVHVGSLEENWTDTSSPASSIEYGENSHLGINGVIRFLHFIKPKLAIVTEFGEELDANLMRFSVVELINQAVSAINVKVLPSDVNLFIGFLNGESLCKCQCSDFVPSQYINYKADGSDTNYSFEAGCQSGLCHVLKSELFVENHASTRKLSYKFIKSKHTSRKKNHDV